MKLLCTSLTAFVLLFGIANTAHAEAQPDRSLDNEVAHYLENNQGADADASTFRVFWKDGIRMESGDGHFKIAMSGRLMFDINSSNADDGIDTANNEDLDQASIGFRRARIYFAGTVYKRVGFKVQFDFASGDLGLRDVFVSLKKMGPGDLVFGHMKQPFSLSEMTSSRYITFTERSASTQAFAPSYDSGIAWFGNLMDDKMLLHVGSFVKTGNNGGGTGSGGLGITIRWGWTIMENSDKNMILFIGVGFTRQDLGISSDGRNQTQVPRPPGFVRHALHRHGRFQRADRHALQRRSCVPYGPAARAG